MNSCLYECHVMHARFSPRPHKFQYRIFLFGLDLDEVPALTRRLPFFSAGRPNLYSFREEDHLPTGEAGHQMPAPAAAGSAAPRTLKERVVAYLATHGLDARDGRIFLVTLPRILGYGFNPVSFYFCFSRDGAPLAAIAEVTNTFREIKPYLLGPATRRDGRPGEFHLRVPKYFYVSPYSDVDTTFDFTLRLPDGRLSIQIDDYVGAERTLTSTLAGPRRELSNGRLAWYTVKYPLLTLRIMAAIHWHALRLWLKRVPWYAKAARALDQKMLYRPHASIARSPAPVPAPTAILPSSDPA